MPAETSSQRGDLETHGAERGLSRFEGFRDAVFAIALTLLIVEPTIYKHRDTWKYMLEQAEPVSDTGSVAEETHPPFGP